MAGKSKSKKHQVDSDRAKQNKAKRGAANPRKLARIKLPRSVETGVPTLIDVSCSHCGGTLEQVDDTHAKCPYCGAAYLIDEPEDLNVNIYLPDHSKLFGKIGEWFGTVKHGLFLFAIYASVFVVFMAFLAVVQGIIGLFTKGEDINPAVRAFYEEVLDGKYQKLSEEDFRRIKYLEIVNWSASGKCRIRYSFTDYAACENDEAFEDTVLEWNGQFDDFDPYMDYGKLKGLTYIAMGDEAHITYPQDAPVTRVSARTLGEVSEKICADEPLQMEKIEVLKISRHDSLNLTELAGYPNLRELDLKVEGGHGSEAVVDMGGLAACPELEKLSVECYAPCIGLARLRELSNLKSLSFPEVITVEQCGFLQDMTQLESLSLGMGGKDSTENLRNLKQLRSLSLSGGHINISELPDFPCLEELDCEVGSIREFGCVTRFPTLKRCKVYVSDIGREQLDLSVLKDMKNLESLQIGVFMMPTVSHLECALNLENLEQLRIWGVAQLHNKVYICPDQCEENDTLKELYLSRSTVYEEGTAEKNYDVIGRLTGLEKLTIMDCELEELDFLSGLSNLRELNVEKNNIRDYSPLAECPKLEKLYSGGNPIIDPDLPAQVEVVPYITGNR